MTENAEHDLKARWTRAGATFNIAPAESSPDLESLLLETAPAVSGDPRLFTMAISWLCKYETLISKHTLKAKIRDSDPKFKPVLGLMLDIARARTGTSHLSGAIDECMKAEEPQPLFEIERKKPSFRIMAEQRASTISRNWNLWAPEFEPKEDAIRPPQWVMKVNPSYIERGNYKGDLRSSVVEELKRHPDSGASESELARRCGAARIAVRDAIASLELVARVERIKDRNRMRIRLIPQ